MTLPTSLISSSCPVTRTSAVACELVEMGPRGEHGDLGIGGRITLHVDLGQLDAPGLRISAGSQVEPQDELERLEGGHLVEEAFCAQFDQLFGALGHRQRKRKALDDPPTFCVAGSRAD